MPMSSALEGRRTEAFVASGARLRGRRAGRLRARDVIVPGARDKGMRPYDSSRPRRPIMQCRALELCCSASQPFGEQRTRSHPYFGAACFRQRTLFVPLVLRSPQLAAQLNSAMYNLALIRQETSAWSGREPSAFDFLRL